LVEELDRAERTPGGVSIEKKLGHLHYAKERNSSSAKGHQQGN